MDAAALGKLIWLLLPSANETALDAAEPTTNTLMVVSPTRCWETTREVLLTEGAFANAGAAIGSVPPGAVTTASLQAATKPVSSAALAVPRRRAVAEMGDIDRGVSGECVSGESSVSLAVSRRGHDVNVVTEVHVL